MKALVVLDVPDIGSCLRIDSIAAVVSIGVPLLRLEDMSNVDVWIGDWLSMSLATTGVNAFEHAKSQIDSTSFDNGNEFVSILFFVSKNQNKFEYRCANETTYSSVCRTSPST